jgi:hypothetical protein
MGGPGEGGGIGRRGLAWLLPAGIAACADPAPPEQLLRPIGYGYLLPLPLQVASLVVEPGNPPTQPGDIGRTLAMPPAEAVRVMARDRLSAVGTQGGSASFRVTQASMLRQGSAIICQLGCRLEVDSGTEEGGRGFVEASARAQVSGADAARPQAAERLLRRAMELLNVEFEFQIKRNLRRWLVTVGPGSRGTLPAPAAGAVEREDLPRS